MNLLFLQSLIRRPLVPLLVLALAGSTGWALRLDHLRAGHAARADKLQGQANQVVGALRTASGNDKLTWADAVAQIRAMGQSIAELKQSVTTQNASIDGMVEEGRRLAAQAQQARRDAEVAHRARSRTVAHLDWLAKTPSQPRTDAEALKAAEEALDAAYKAGL